MHGFDYSGNIIVQCVTVKSWYRQYVSCHHSIARVTIILLYQCLVSTCHKRDLSQECFSQLYFIFILGSAYKLGNMMSKSLYSHHVTNSRQNQQWYHNGFTFVIKVKTVLKVVSRFSVSSLDKESKFKLYSIKSSVTAPT